jgi:hypothetical protein
MEPVNSQLPRSNFQDRWLGVGRYLISGFVCHSRNHEGIRPRRRRRWPRNFGRVAQLQRRARGVQRAAEAARVAPALRPATWIAERPIASALELAGVCDRPFRDPRRAKRGPRGPPRLSASRRSPRYKGQRRSSRSSEHPAARRSLVSFVSFVAWFSSWSRFD